MYLRSICGPYLDEDNRIGTKYTVIVADAIEKMEEFLVSDTLVSSKYFKAYKLTWFQENGQKFDYVFGDLTDLPVDARGISDSEVMDKFFNLGFSNLLAF